MADGGADLEHFELRSYQEAQSILMQVLLGESLNIIKLCTQPVTHLHMMHDVKEILTWVGWDILLILVNVPTCSNRAHAMAVIDLGNCSLSASMPPALSFPELQLQYTNVKLWKVCYQANRGACCGSDQLCVFNLAPGPLLDCLGHRKVQTA